MRAVNWYRHSDDQKVSTGESARIGGDFKSVRSHGSLKVSGADFTHNCLAGGGLWGADHAAVAGYVDFGGLGDSHVSLVVDCELWGRGRPYYDFQAR